MQTFHSSSSRKTASPSDVTVLPSYEALYGSSNSSPEMTIPIMPDVSSNLSSGGYHSLCEPSLDPRQPTIVAADPERVMPAKPFSEVDTVGLDGVELKFAHEGASSSSSAELDPSSHQGGMLRDMWKGMVEDILGEPAKKAH